MTRSTFLARLALLLLLAVSGATSLPSGPPAPAAAGVAPSPSWALATTAAPAWQTRDEKLSLDAPTRALGAKARPGEGDPRPAERRPARGL